MKKADILKVLSEDFETAELEAINKLLRAKGVPGIRYRMAGKELGHLGFTGIIKTITAEGLKVFDVNKVTLIRFAEIETFEKAKPREPRHTGPKPVKLLEKAKPFSRNKKKSVDEDSDTPETKKKAPGKNGSSFIRKPEKN